MSATNRGSIRNEADYYVTPRQTAVEFLDKFQALEPGFDFPTAYLLDPCAGGDRAYPMTYPSVLQERGATQITTIDIRKDSPAGIKTDYLEFPKLGGYDGIFTNPPFALAVPFILESLRDVRQGGFVAMLGRLNLFGSQDRRGFWMANMPKYTIVHSRRPNFLTDELKAARRAEGKSTGTDATEYAHFVWQKGYKTEYSQTYII